LTPARDAQVRDGNAKMRVDALLEAAGAGIGIEREEQHALHMIRDV
jgi:hypothetical protein